MVRKGITPLVALDSQQGPNFCVHGTPSQGSHSLSFEKGSTAFWHHRLIVFFKSSACACFVMALVYGTSVSVCASGWRISICASFLSVQSSASLYNLGTCSLSLNLFPSVSVCQSPTQSAPTRFQYSSDVIILSSIDPPTPPPPHTHTHSPHPAPTKKKKKDHTPQQQNLEKRQ